MTADCRLTIRLSTAERSRLQEAADGRGVSLSDYVRRLICGPIHSETVEEAFGVAGAYDPPCMFVTDGRERW